MKNLRFLQLNNVELTGKFKHFPKELRWLSWHGCPFKSMPKHLLNQRKLVALHLPHSKLTRGLKISEPLVNLKILDLNDSRKFKKSPNFSRLPNLEVLDFYGCSSLSEIHRSIGQLKREVPEGLGQMESLRILDARAGIEQFPNDLGSLISLQSLYRCSDSCRSLPSLSGLSNLVVLRLSCRNLRAIPDLPTNLQALDADHCPKLETMPDFSHMSNMRRLILSLGESLNSLAWLSMEGCTNLTAEFRKNILQGWTTCGDCGIFLNKIYDIPVWFEIVADGNKGSFDVPQCDDRNFKGLTHCFLSSRIEQAFYLQAITVVNCTKHTNFKASLGLWNMKEDCFWQGQLSNDKLSLQGGDKIVILLKDFGVKKIGVNLVWNKPLKENLRDDVLGKIWYEYESEPHPDWLSDESSAGPSHDASDNHPTNQ